MVVRPVAAEAPHVKPAGVGVVPLDHPEGVLLRLPRAAPTDAQRSSVICVVLAYVGGVTDECVITIVLFPAHRVPREALEDGDGALVGLAVDVVGVEPVEDHGGVGERVVVGVCEDEPHRGVPRAPRHEEEAPHVRGADALDDLVEDRAEANRVRERRLVDVLPQPGNVTLTMSAFSPVCRQSFSATSAP